MLCVSSGKNAEALLSLTVALSAVTDATSRHRARISCTTADIFRAKLSAERQYHA